MTKLYHVVDGLEICLNNVKSNAYTESAYSASLLEHSMTCMMVQCILHVVVQSVIRLFRVLVVAPLTHTYIIK